MKAQVSMIEMILAVIALFVAFNLLFHGFSFKSGWKDASLLMNGRDIIITMDRINKLSESSFNSTYFQYLIDRFYPTRDNILWTSVDDTIKSRLVIACNCTNDQRSNLEYWLKNLKFNNRSIDVSICETNLETINLCLGKYPDVLIIWNYKDLSQDRYMKVMREFLNNGNGIVEIADIPIADNTQKQIFGIDACAGQECEWDVATQDTFQKYDSFDSPTYYQYKYFSHIPLPVKTYDIVGSIPVEGVPACSATATKIGNFSFKGNLMDFWICNNSAVYFDTNNNNIADYVAEVRKSFSLANDKFFLSYIESSSIMISFNQSYNFTDFLKAGNTKVIPIDQDNEKVFLYYGNYSKTGSLTNNFIPVVVINSTTGKTAWIADFTRSGWNNVNDDHKQLLNSLILSISNKKSKELTSGTLGIGQITSYVNVINYDMFEIYKLNLGVEYPF